MGSTRRSFSEEYKREAVNFVLEGRSVAEVARNIGVHEMTLGRWVRKAKDSDGAAPADAVLGESERLELIRLREQAKNDKAAIAELQMQVEFAKKVATWFAKGKQ
jgi:transposase